MPTMTDHLPQDIRPLDAPAFCEQCDSPDTSNRLDLTTGLHFDICPDCAKFWEEAGAIWA